MFQPTYCLVGSSTDRAQLEALVAQGRTPQKTAQRARSVLMLINRAKPSHVARTLGLSRMRIRLWAQRYVAKGVEGLLRDATRPPGREPVSPERIATIVEMTLRTTPAHATHWTTRTMAKTAGISEAMVRRIWHQHGLQPHRVEHFKRSNDPRFVEKLRDIVGLYLLPPTKAVVFSVDEKSNIQALDRTRPVLALQPHVPERQTHDYIRHGTTTLFAAVRLLDGVVIGECHARHRSKEFITFLKRLDRETATGLDLHLIVDNASTHKSPPVRRWLARHPRVHLHFTPTSSSWLNLVERWFAEITRTRLRRGTFESLPALLRAIRDYLDHYNKSPKPFVWTKNADTILGKIARVSNR
jgi:transposase